MLLDTLVVAVAMDFGIGYQLGIAKDMENDAQAEVSHQVSWVLRKFWCSKPQIGLVFKGALGNLEAFEWKGHTYAKQDGDLLRFSCIVGGSLRFPVTDTFTLVFDGGIGLDSKSISNDTHLGESNAYASIYGSGYDTLTWSISNALMGFALEIAAQYALTRWLYLEAGISVHYSMIRLYTRSLELTDKHQSIFLQVPKDALTLAAEDTVSSWVKIGNMGIPFIHVGIHF
jgi:hypothetical protein